MTLLEPADQAPRRGGSRARSQPGARHSPPAARTSARKALKGAGLQPALRQGRAGPHPPPRRERRGRQPGTIEEALLYAQTYGDVWTDEAKKFLEAVDDEKPAKQASAPAAAERSKRRSVDLTLR